MVFTHAWATPADNTSASTSFANNYVYSDGIPMPAGNLSIEGNRPIAVYGVAADFAAGSGVYSAIVYQGVTTSGPYQFAGSGGTCRHLIGHGSGSLTFGRRIAAGGTVLDSGDGSSWAGTLSGSLTWATVPLPPAAVAAARTGRNVTLTVTGPPSDGGQNLTSYTAQYSKDGGAYTGARTFSGSASTTFENLPPGEYTFIVWATNVVGSGQARAAAPVKVASGGRVRVAGVWRDAITRVRVAGVWRDAIVKVRSGGTWKDAS